MKEVTPKMDARVKRKWVKALRSGKYSKGKYQLRSWDGEAYCCLGVLTDLYIKENKVKSGWKSKSFAPSDASLSPRVMRWAHLKGYSANDPEVKYKGNLGDPGGTTNLSRINDRTKLSFKQIAKIIEKQL